ncbi:MAG: hypothetical protein JSV05_00465 [Candidatus Bathyarchaeota archaeon]|nr:MAG: hypothetical protein JSV05_00465 [Candidatus Bathyarchaeota archaeon]
MELKPLSEPKKLASIVIGILLLLAIPIATGFVNTNVGESTALQAETTYYPDIDYSNIKSCNETPGDGNWTDPILNTLGNYHAPPFDHGEIGVLEITEPRLVYQVEIFGSGCEPPVNLTCNGITQEIQHFHDSAPLGNETIVFNITPAKIVTIYTTQHDEDVNRGFGVKWITLYYVPRIVAILDIDPDTLNLRSQGSWITVYIELPNGHEVSDINVSTVLLNDTIPAESHPMDVEDHDEDNITDLMVKFNRADVIDFISNSLASTEKFQIVTLTVTGTLSTLPQFEGSDEIRIISRTGMH